MPRDLFPQRSPEEARTAKSQEQQTSDKLNEGRKTEGYNELTIYSESHNKVQLSEGMKKAEKRNDLHPYVTTLSLADVESCIRLEDASFPEHERCSREKFIYRLSKCGELSLGLFATATPHSTLNSASTAVSARPPDSATPDKKGVLLAHVVATKCDSKAVTDESMDFPPEWQHGVKESERRGHQEKGRTIAVHSLAVLPAYQRVGLGKTVMKSYIQRLESSGIVDRIALLAHGHLIEYYESFGFVNKGESTAQFGGGSWNEMVNSDNLFIVVHTDSAQVYEFSNTGNGS
ncbi:MAG: hypothetical protein M1830_004157 [Pleopsidium flavum]|nr:MAG: hypothetical protein M1830_004157 [Pleopsidium flavum]